ncbi:acyl carrier protein [Nocardia huaxiensis]|uniref:Acyl carrier protein n=1 Tax=Nocardia huaxiensis TaxID=2755382 RepID=A0A7D6V7I2_9NOCA|nr:phosphopantetheine-binding protein [Nocardia huaxiensis]QLY28594.1 acyl carrier protein [Nocardia huaxiensis]UFS97935.1 phosphopantetheine-binding protein [Nocardia huaxiensis]
MPATITRQTADTLIRNALRGFAPDSVLLDLPVDAPLRETLDLDSIDFLTFIERLSAARGARIDEDDYPRLATIAAGIDFLAEID